MSISFGLDTVFRILWLQVGFQLGLFREGYTAIASPQDCLNVSPVSKAYVDIVQVRS